MILDLQDIHFSIQKHHILQGLSLKINSGETVGVIGPNGSGKTTLLNVLSGFAAPQSGTIIYRGENITKVKAYKRSKKGIARVFQNFGIFKELTLLENILVALESKQGLFKTIIPWAKQNKINRLRAMSYLRKVKLHHKAKDKASSLSGGQMRLLEIIRALAFGADLFLLDEPTAGVSPKMKSDIIKLIQKLQKNNKTVVIVEHDIDFLQSFCERIVVVNTGKIFLDGKPSDIMNSDELKEIYFGKDD